MSSSLPHEDFDEFTTLENFERAWIYVRNSVRYEVKDWLGLSIYSSQREKHLSLLISDLTHYKPQSAEVIYKPKKDGSLRPEIFLSMDDRIMFQAMGNIIAQKTYNDIMVFADNRVFAHIPNNPFDNTNKFFFRRTFSTPSYYKNPIQGQYNKYKEQIKSTIDEFLVYYENPWILKTDIASFYPSISHKKLRTTLEESWGFDSKFLDLLDVCLEKWKLSDCNQGIPIGYETSDILATVYLLSLDKYLEDENFQVIRFVDDIYIFTDTQDKAKEALFKFDKYLQTLKLNRNAHKTTISLLNEKKKGEILEGLEQDSTIEDLHPDEDKTIENNTESISRKAYILYRSRSPNSYLRDDALYIIENEPRYTIHATTYLYRNYAKDNTVIGFLYKILSSNYEPTSVRLHCFDALMKMVGIEYLFDFASEYLHNGEDWYFKYKILDSFPTNKSQSINKKFFDFVFDFAKQESHPSVQAMAIDLSFRLARKSQEDSKSKDDYLVEIISLAFHSKNEFIKKLGIYLMRRRIGILDRLPLASLGNRLQSHFLNDAEIASIQNFRTSFKRVFNFDLFDGFPIEDVFGHDASQIMIDIADRLERGFVEFTKYCYQLTRRLLFYLARHRQLPIDDNMKKKTIDEFIKQFFSQDTVIYENTSFLTRLIKHSSSDEKLRDKLLNELKNLFIYCTDEVYKLRYGGDMRERDKIFICYARTDERWTNEVMKHVKPYFSHLNQENPIWYDRKIEANTYWDEEIKKTLSLSKIAILLISPSFLESDYIRTDELAYIIESHKRKDIAICWIPIIPSVVNNVLKYIASIQSVVTDNQPLSLIKDKEGDLQNELTKIAERIIAIYNK